MHRVSRSLTAAQGLEHAIVGTSSYVVGPEDDVKESAMEDMRSVMSRIDKSGEGVYVQALTLIRSTTRVSEVTDNENSYQWHRRRRKRRRKPLMKLSQTRRAREMLMKLSQTRRAREMLQVLIH